MIDGFSDFVIKEEKLTVSDELIYLFHLDKRLDPKNIPCDIRYN